MNIKGAPDAHHKYVKVARGETAGSAINVKYANYSH